MFDYRDNMGQTSRRVVPSRGAVQAAVTDASLEDRIIRTELANVVARCLAAYGRLLENGGASKSFWSICPEVLRDAQIDAQMEGNLVQRFLTAGPDESATLTTRTYVRQRQGAVTEWTEFKKAFDAYVKYKHPQERWILRTDEGGPFVRLGYKLVQENMCKMCGKPGLSGCCTEYAAANRVKRWRIMGMELVREAVAVDGDAWQDDLEYGIGGVR